MRCLKALLRGLLAAPAAAAPAPAPAPATWDPANTEHTLVLSDGNLTVTQPAAVPQWTGTSATLARTTGKFVFAIKAHDGSGVNATDINLGIVDATWQWEPGSLDWPGVHTLNSVLIYNDAGDTANGNVPRYDGSYGGDYGEAAGVSIPDDATWLMIAVDLDAGKVWVRDASGWGGGDPATGTGPCLNFPSGHSYTPFAEVYGWATANFGAIAMPYPIPAGFATWES